MGATPQLSKIIGQENTLKDLFNTFKFFMNDEDEQIQSIAIQHLVDLLPVLPSLKRSELFDLLVEICQESGIMWRIRLHAARQISVLTRLLDPDIVREKLIAVAIEFATDSVYSVRLEAAKNLGKLINCFEEMGEEDYLLILIRQICFFSVSDLSSHRQLYLKICDNLIRIVSKQNFKCFLEKAFNLAEDKVINVRITLSSFLNKNKKFIGDNKF